jgi:hypothetical protein
MIYAPKKDMKIPGRQINGQKGGAACAIASREVPPIVSRNPRVRSCVQSRCKKYDVKRVHDSENGLETYLTYVNVWTANSAYSKTAMQILINLGEAVVKKLTAILAATCFAVSGLVLAGDLPPMPQTRGMQGMDPKLHDPANKPTITCTPKPGTETMDHAPADHPMPQTRGMQGMDPAQHMSDCESSDKAPPVPKNPHVHRAP